MKTLLTCLYFSLLLSVAAMAQTKQKAEKAFVAELNKIISNSKEQHWAYKGVMTIDSAFAINKKGDLSVTVRYTEEADVVIARMVAPIKRKMRVAYDLYLILEYNDNYVSAYETAKNSTYLKELEQTNYFHIGVPLYEGYEQQEKLQKLLDNLLKYYKN